MISAIQAKRVSEEKELDKIEENAKHFCETILNQRIKEFAEDGYKSTFYISKIPMFLRQDFYKPVKDYLESKGYHVFSCYETMISIDW